MDKRAILGNKQLGGNQLEEKRMHRKRNGKKMRNNIREHKQRRRIVRKTI